MINGGLLLTHSSTAALNNGITGVPHTNLDTTEYTKTLSLSLPAA